MNTFKRKALFTAVVAGLGAAAGTAEAVYLNPNGTGEALVYPYYTVNSAGGNVWNTYISVVNTTSRSKAVKVRFLEGRVSNEVLDFNLYLSPNDVWTAAVVPSDDGAGAKIITADVSCTSPFIPGAPKGVPADVAGFFPTPGGVVGQPFTNVLYAARNPELGKGLDRTREGHVELIEMGDLVGATATAITHTTKINSTTGLQFWAPANCGVVQALGFVPVAGDIVPPTGGLMGTGTLINVNSGTDVGYKADALAAFSTITQFSDAGAASPDLSQADPTSVVLQTNDGSLTPTALTAYRSNFAASANASAGAKATASVFMHTTLMNEYILDAATNSATDWVITQPVKKYFTTDLLGVVPDAPYTATLTTTGACESAFFTIFDREERTVQGSVGFSPGGGSAGGGSNGTLCWETTVVSFLTTTPAAGAPSSILGSVNNLNVTVPPGFQNGWTNVDFRGTRALSGMATSAGERVDLNPAQSNALGGTAITAPIAGVATFHGLPVTGFMMRTFQNNVLSCGTIKCQGNYSALFNHSYKTSITP